MKALSKQAAAFPTAIAVAGTAAFSMSTLFSAVKPLLVTRFDEQIQFSPAFAGFVAALPFVGIAASSFGVNRVLRSVSYATSVQLAGGVLVVCQALAIFLFMVKPVIAALQLASGLSVGLLMGLTSRLVAQTQHPHKLFGLVDGMAVLLMAFMVVGASHAVAAFGLKGAFAFGALASLVYFALMALNQPTVNPATLEVPPIPPAGRYRPWVIILMGMLFVTFSGMGYAFMFTAAKQLQLSYAYSGNVIGLLLLFSAAACFGGGYVSHHFGVTKPLISAYLASALGWWVALTTGNSLVFFIALIPATYAIQFGFPILLAFAGEQDDQGKWAAIATPLLTSGFAWAAISAGIVVQLWDIQALAVANLCGMAVCSALLVYLRSTTANGQ